MRDFLKGAGLLLLSAVLIPIVIATYNKYSDCTTDAARIQNDYVKLENEYFYRRSYISFCLQNSTSIDTLQEKFSKIPILYGVYKDMSVMDVSAEYKVITDRIEGHKRWDPMQKPRPQYDYIQFGKMPPGLTNKDVSELAAYGADLQDIDAQNKKERQTVLLFSHCFCWTLKRLGFSESPYILSPIE